MFFAANASSAHQKARISASRTRVAAASGNEIAITPTIANRHGLINFHDRLPVQLFVQHIHWVRLKAQKRSKVCVRLDLTTRNRAKDMRACTQQCTRLILDDARLTMAYRRPA